MPKTPDEIFKKKIDHMLAAEVSLDKSIIKFESRVYELLLAEYLPLFELEDGLIVNSRHNDSLLLKIDNFFKKLEKVLYRDVLGGFTRGLLRSSNLSSDYYIALGFKKTVVDSVLRNKVRLESKLGIKPGGKLAKEGYLYKLGQTDAARQKLKNYILMNIGGDKSFLDFQLGFRNVVKGNKRVKGVAANGYLKQYFAQYANDTYAQMDAVTNKQMAKSLQLEHFIYQGSLIDTSRRFCEKRAGKAFTVKETKNWKDDPDLIDKKTKASYNPLIERGRYNCRHFIKYITKELYNEFKNRK